MAITMSYGSLGLSGTRSCNGKQTLSIGSLVGRMGAFCRLFEGSILTNSLVNSKASSSSAAVK